MSNRRQSLRTSLLKPRAGEVLGIGGLIGAGRTELIKHIFGAFGQRTNGTVILNGSSLDNNTPI